MLLTIVSDYTRYNPSIPMKLPFPGPSQCVKGRKLMLVGKISHGQVHSIGINFALIHFTKTNGFVLFSDCEFSVPWIKSWGRSFPCFC